MRYHLVALAVTLVVVASWIIRDAAANHANPRALLHTNYGVITFELLPQYAPLTVRNFIELATSGFYNHTYFYRLELGFVLQGGGYYANQTSNITVPLEYHLPNSNWTVGLAREGGLPNSGSSEYFINIGNNSATLAPGGSSVHGYAVFATVVDGFDVIFKLETLPTHYSNNDGMTKFDKPWPLISHMEIVTL